MKLKKFKILDIQASGVPEDVKKYVLEYFNRGNGSFISYYVGDITSDEDKENVLDKFLLEKTDCKDFEEILIKYWW